MSKRLDISTEKNKVNCCSARAISLGAIVWRSLRHPLFSRFDKTSICN